MSIGVSRLLRRLYLGSERIEAGADRVRNFAQDQPEPCEDEAEIVSDGGEEGVCGVAVSSFEEAPSEMAFGFHCPMMGSTADLCLGSRLMVPRTPHIWPEI
jgi:hypothetical protein